MRGWGRTRLGPAVRVRDSSGSGVELGTNVSRGSSLLHAAGMAAREPTMRHLATSSATRAASPRRAAMSRAWLIECWARLVIQAILAEEHESLNRNSSKKTAAGTAYCSARMRCFRRNAGSVLHEAIVSSILAPSESNSGIFFVKMSCACLRIWSASSVWCCRCRIIAILIKQST